MPCVTALCPSFAGRVGGLADTVVDLNNETREADTATGFVFAPHLVRADASLHARSQHLPRPRRLGVA